MKNLFILIISVIFVSSLFSCEKQQKTDLVENYDENSTHIFINPNWQIVSDSYTDKNGNVGILYENLNNSKEKLFQIKTLSKAVAVFKGYYVKQTHQTASGENQVWYSCVASAVDNCKTTITSDEQGNISVTLELKPGAIPH